VKIWQYANLSFVQNVQLTKSNGCGFQKDTQFHFKCAGGCLNQMFDWDEFKIETIDYYAKLSMKPGWLEYVRGKAKEFEQEPLLKGISIEIAKRIAELKDEKKN
jgi:hypothetical protein